MFLAVRNRERDSEIKKINEKIERLEKRVLNFENKSSNKNKPCESTESLVKQKLFKVDKKVLARWNKFVAEHRHYKVQHLISLAMQEFIDKYEKVEDIL